MNKEIMIDEPFITYDREMLLNFLKEHNIDIKKINKLLKLIKDFGDEEDTFIKLSYHLRFYNNDSVKKTIKDLIKRFPILMNRYSVYRNYESRVEWAEAFNDEFQLIDLYNYEDIYYHFNEDLKDSFISKLKDNIDLEELENIIDSFDLEELLKILHEKEILENLPFSISPYIYWEGKVRKLGNYGFIIEYWDNDIIVVEC